MVCNGKDYSLPTDTYSQKGSTVTDWHLQLRWFSRSAWKIDRSGAYMEVHSSNSIVSGHHWPKSASQALDNHKIMACWYLHSTLNAQNIHASLQSETLHFASFAIEGAMKTFSDSFKVSNVILT